MRTNAKRMRKFQRELFRWYERKKRRLPWRGLRDPYRILVSEIMLQQTQVDRVKPKYEAFLKKFPTVRALAAAARSDVLRQWRGLGYNSRAVRLHDAARVVVGTLRGRFPRTVEGLRQLPGVGPYTAAAVAAFAFGADVAAVDTNHERAVGRYFFGARYGKKNAHERAAGLVPAGEGGRWNHALMDFGALVCTSRPKCFECPLRDGCAAFPAVVQLKREKKNGERFFGSNRFFRGQLVDALREAPRGLTERDLWKEFGDYPSMTRQRLDELLAALAKDGIVTRRGGRFHLG